MKKILAMLLSLALCLSLLAACGGSETAGGDEAGGEEVSDSDLAYVQDKGVLVVGMTDFEPMDYKNDSGEWIGFDADMARAFAESLGVNVEFIEISWANKAVELETKAIDVVWNGMTINDEVKGLMGVSNAYCMNAQVVVLRADIAEQYATVESLQELSFAAEDGSAGAEALDLEGIAYTAVDTQAKALMEVASGSVQACVIDLLMAGAMIGEGTSYPELVATVELTSEEYGVGFRQESDLIAAFNSFWKDAYDAGTVQACAETYGIAQNIIAQ